MQYLTVQRYSKLLLTNIIRTPSNCYDGHDDDTSYLLTTLEELFQLLRLRLQFFTTKFKTSCNNNPVGTSFVALLNDIITSLS